MFPELTNAFAPLQSSSNNTVSSGSFLLVSDSCKADGSFILQHLLHTYLKANKGVCLVGLEQSFFHYCSIGRKLGVNLESDQFKSKFSFINGLSTPYKQFLSSKGTEDTNNFSFDENQPVSFIQQIKQSTNLVGEEGCAIIIDNINVLINLLGEVSVADLIHHLKLLCEELQNNSIVVCLIHDNNLPNSIATIAHMAEAVIVVEDFETGYSKEIHGQTKRSIRHHLDTRFLRILSSSFPETSTVLSSTPKNNNKHEPNNRMSLYENVSLETTMGTIVLELYWDHCPKTCKNFVELSRRGYYDGVIFHRIIKDFMIQGGDPTGTGRGGESIYGKTFEDEITPSLKHTGAGILSMANAGPNTNGSQFFISLAPCPWLDGNDSDFFQLIFSTGKHTIFGRIAKGMQVVKRLGNVQTNASDRPLEDVKILKARVVVGEEE